MSLVSHVVALGLLIVALIFGATVFDQFWGRWAAMGFEFLLILGYVLFVLQWGVPWGRRDSGDSGDRG